MSKRKTIEEFTQEAAIVHSNYYDYSKVTYTTSHNKITITCPIHGDFTQKPYSHLQGIGCKQCGIEKAHKATRKSFEAFKLKANQMHDGKYEYVEKTYKSNTGHVDIICPIHGTFSQNAVSHSNGGKGCPECAKDASGWSYTKWAEQGDTSCHFDAYKVYVIRCWNATETFYKIGKTFLTVGKRFYNKERMPYEWELVHTYIGSSKYISDLEVELLRKHQDYVYTPLVPFAGSQRECFSTFIE